MWPWASLLLLGVAIAASGAAATVRIEGCPSSISSRLCSELEKASPRARVVAWIEFCQAESRGWGERTNEVFEAAGEASVPVGRPQTKVRAESEWLNALSVSAPPHELLAMGRLPSVCRVERVATYSSVTEEPTARVSQAEAETLAQSRRRGFASGPELVRHQTVGIDRLHGQGLDGTGVRIAVLDTGFDEVHPAFSSANVLGSWDFVHNLSGAGHVFGDVVEQVEHGTNVWGILAGDTNQTFVGVAPRAEYLLGKVERKTFEGIIEEDYFVKGMEWAVTNGANIIVASLGYPLFYDYEDADGASSRSARAVRKAIEANVLCVIAVGNSGYLNGPATPGDVDLALSVGALNTSDLWANFSTVGPTYDGRIKPEVCAPGHEIYTTSSVRFFPYTRATGTSFAAPLVAGAAALVWQRNPAWTALQVRQAIIDTAVDPRWKDEGDSPRCGWGIVNAFAAAYNWSAVASKCPFSCSKKSEPAASWCDDTASLCHCSPTTYGYGCQYSKLECDDICLPERGTCNVSRMCECKRGFGGPTCQGVVELGEIPYPQFFAVIMVVTSGFVLLVLLFTATYILPPNPSHISDHGIDRTPMWARVLLRYGTFLLVASGIPLMDIALSMAFFKGDVKPYSVSFKNVWLAFDFIWKLFTVHVLFRRSLQWELVVSIGGAGALVHVMLSLPGNIMILNGEKDTASYRVAVSMQIIVLAVLDYVLLPFGYKHAMSMFHKKHSKNALAAIADSDLSDCSSDLSVAGSSDSEIGPTFSEAAGKLAASSMSLGAATTRKKHRHGHSDEESSDSSHISVLEEDTQDDHGDSSPKARSPVGKRHKRRRKEKGKKGKHKRTKKSKLMKRRKHHSKKKEQQEGTVMDFVTWGCLAWFVLFAVIYVWLPAWWIRLIQTLSVIPVSVILVIDWKKKLRKTFEYFYLYFFVVGALVLVPVELISLAYASVSQNVILVTLLVLAQSAIMAFVMQLAKRSALQMSTQSRHPLFLFRMQYFVEFLGLILYVRRDASEAGFWALLTFQAGWGLVRNTRMQGIAIELAATQVEKLQSMTTKTVHETTSELLSIMELASQYMICELLAVISIVSQFYLQVLLNPLDYAKIIGVEPRRVWLNYFFVVVAKVTVQVLVWVIFRVKVKAHNEQFKDYPKAQLRSFLNIYRDNMLSNGILFTLLVFASSRDAYLAVSSIFFR
jgi:Subtilase family